MKNIKSQLKKANVAKQKFAVEVGKLEDLLKPHIDFDFSVVDTTDGICITDGDMMNTPVDHLFELIENKIIITIDVANSVGI